MFYKSASAFRHLKINLRVNKLRFRSKWVSLFYVIALVAMLLGSGTKLAAQDLEYVPPVIADRANKDTATSIVIATIDQSKYDNKYEPKSYVNGIQIVDADEPWPPRWYAARPVYTNEDYARDVKSLTQRIDFMESPTFVDGYLLFIQVKPITRFDGKHPFDTQHGNAIKVMSPQMQLVDSVKTPLFYGGKYDPGYRTNAKIEELTILRTDSIFDLRDISGNEKDSAVEGLFGVMQVFNNHDSLVLVWDPMKHLPLGIFHLKEKLMWQSNQQGGGNGDLRFTKICNVNWDCDGNMLYTILNCSLGKVSRKDGHVLWHFDTDDMPQHGGPGTFESYAPSDFKYLGQNDSEIIYSFFERGAMGRATARGVVFALNRKTQNARVIKYAYPQHKYIPTGQGGYDFDLTSGNYLIDYGIFENADTTINGFWDAFEYGNKDRVSAVYRVPKWNYAFGVHTLDGWPRPPRPVIVSNGTELSAVGPMQEWTWYSLGGKDNTAIKKLGNGARITPVKGVTYCVAGTYGIGYSVSKAITYRP